MFYSKTLPGTQLLPAQPPPPHSSRLGSLAIRSPLTPAAPPTQDVCLSAGTSWKLKVAEGPLPGPGLSQGPLRATVLERVKHHLARPNSLRNAVKQGSKQQPLTQPGGGTPCSPDSLMVCKRGLLVLFWVSPQHVTLGMAAPVSGSFLRIKSRHHQCFLLPKVLLAPGQLCLGHCNTSYLMPLKSVLPCTFLLRHYSSSNAASGGQRMQYLINTAQNHYEICEKQK